jgi:hypothetical protein
MKTRIFTHGARAGYALLMVMAVTGAMLIVVAATVSRSMTNAKMNSRSNEYSVTCNAAEAAVEKVVARMGYDFQSYGPGGVNGNLGLYQTNSLPNEDPYWNTFAFSDGNRHSNQTYVALMTNSYSGPLPSQYPGLSTLGAPIYRIVSNARLASGGVVTGTAQEDVLLALVPLTQYAIFYNGLLEFSTCAAMTVNGRVHANGSIYTGSSASLTFNGTVTASGTISSPAWNGQGPWSKGQTGTFNGSPPSSTNVPTVALSIGTTNVYTNVYATLQLPPAGESPTSTQGENRFCNQAQTVLLVSNTAVTMKIQAGLNYQVPGDDPTPLFLSSTNTPSALATNFPFLSTTNSFTDQRENKTVLATQIDVGKYNKWLQTNSSILAKFPAGSGTYPTILYVANNRTTTSSQIPGVRLTNGIAAPVNGGLGWSVATPDPLYVLGNYNCPNSSYLGTTNTTASVPCAFMSDALTILSGAWKDSQSGSSYNGRNASDTTVNAAILTGIVPSTGSSSSQFSGGVHNLPRLLEDWSNQTLTLNTAIMNLFSSQIATHQFVNGTYYNPPTRQFSYDANYANANKQPPGIPCAMVLIRIDWAAPPANTVTYNVAP